MFCLLDQLKIVSGLLNKIYKARELLGDWLVSTFIPLFHKANVKKCSDLPNYRHNDPDTERQRRGVWSLVSTTKTSAS